MINDRYAIRQHIGKGGMGEVFLADDLATLQPVALKIGREDTHMPGDDEALRQEMIAARSVASPNVCRVHDLVLSAYGPILVMEHIAGTTLHKHIREQRSRGGYSCDEFRRIASDVCQGLTAIHAKGLVHGDVKPGNVMVTACPDGSFDRAVVLDFGFAKERDSASRRGPGALPDGGTANYMSPERLITGDASVEDDLYGLGLTLWEMWTWTVPDPGVNPRARPMRQQTTQDVLAGLSVDEIKQLFWALSPDPGQRLAARHFRFYNPTTISTGSAPVRRERLDSGPPPGRNASTFVSGAQSLLVTFAANAPELVGELFALDKPELSIGQRSDVDVVVAEPTVGAHHADLKWAIGSWRLEDAGSETGTYDEQTCGRRAVVDLPHGGEVQLGELRLKLVSYARNTRLHQRARAILARRDGLTGLLTRKRLLKALNEEWLFSDWVEQSLVVARYEIRGPGYLAPAAPTVTELLALRQAATTIVEATDALLLSLFAATAGRTGPLGFAVVMVGPKPSEAQTLVDQLVGHLKRVLPSGIELVASITHHAPGAAPGALIDPA